MSGWCYGAAEPQIASLAHFLRILQMINFIFKNKYLYLYQGKFMLAWLDTFCGLWGNWWATRDLNPWPLQCECSALPAELAAQNLACNFSFNSLLSWWERSADFQIFRLRRCSWASCPSSQFFFNWMPLYASGQIGSHQSYPCLRSWRCFCLIW